MVSQCRYGDLMACKIQLAFLVDTAKQNLSQRTEAKSGLIWVEGKF
uniref:Uncharacterized protein n=1 Tax=viral metagenome TaxID=1070528 RepID=A0A6M3KAN6_9ZZZZ